MERGGAAGGAKPALLQKQSRPPLEPRRRHRGQHRGHRHDQPVQKRTSGVVGVSAHQARGEAQRQASAGAGLYVVAVACQSAPMVSPLASQRLDGRNTDDRVLCIVVDRMPSLSHACAEKTKLRGV